MATGAGSTPRSAIRHSCQSSTHSPSATPHPGKSLATGLATKLVAHHVNVLSAWLCDPGSEADRRRTYLRLEAGALASLVPRMDTADRVVFVCAQLAAALCASAPAGQSPPRAPGRRLASSPWL